MSAKATEKKPQRITVRRLRSDDWPVIERLFGANGACGGCWCMWWRVARGGKLWEASKGAKNKRAFKKLVAEGAVHGCLAFAGEEPVGWCCVGPRADFPRLERTKALATEWNERTWSVTCFYIKAGWRHRGVASALLAEAVKVARTGGAKRLEGYPVRIKGGRSPGSFEWTGVPGVFERNRFRVVTPPGNPRDIVVRTFR
jgi:GNAT superfamily N-acetyltransferase